MKEQLSLNELLSAVDSTTEPSKPIIFIVDDEPLNRFLITEALAVDHYTIVEAESGEAAVEYMTHHSVDLILLDIDMPGMGGLAACKAIRALPHGRLVPIAMVTGLDDSTSITQAFDCGATDFLTKPVNWTLMQQRVRFMLRLGSITQELQRNEQALEQAQEIAQIGHWRWDAASGVIVHSPAYCRLLPGLPPRISGISFELAATTEFGNTILAEIRRAFAQRAPNFSFECDADIPTRGKRRLLYHGTIEYSDGKPLNLVSTVQDITQRFRDEERYAAIFEASAVGILETNCTSYIDVVEQPNFHTLDDAQLLEISESLIKGDVRMFVVKANSVAGNIFAADAGAEWLKTLRSDMALKFLQAIRDHRRDLVMKCEVPQANGEIQHLIISFRLPQTRDDFHRVVVSINDITDLIRREAQLKRADAIIANTSDAIAIMDKNRRILAINPAYTKVLGYTIDEAQQTKMLTHLLGRTEEQTRQIIRSTLDKQGYWRGEVELLRKDGSLLPALMQVNLMRNENGEVDGLFSITSDISHIKESERRMYQLAHFDELTGLPNRLSLQERLQNELENNSAHEFALLYIDLDGFKLVNDSMGHPTGDKLLRDVSARLQSCCLPGDLLTRIGGDEFALLMFAGIKTADIEQQADRILHALDTPFIVDGREIFIGASIGACRYPADATNASEMLRNADNAMYEAKRLGRGQLCYYSAELTDESNRRLQVENELRVAIASNQLFLVYQPQYDAVSGAIIGAEALVRWRNPRRGVVPPGEFIQIAESSGLIVPLGEWVINEACRQIAEWQHDSGCAVPVAVNISALHLRQHNLPQVLSDAFKRFGIAPNLFEIEITEDSLDFRGEENAPYGILNKLSALGVSIAIDDFGTGYSSLSRLKEMPISTLKIDRSFVRDIASSESDHAIITAIVGLAKTLGMAIVAEGVETEEQAEKLRSLKCNILQGFLYSKPIAPAELVQKFMVQQGASAQNF
ncbi:MAG: EAL domain-containing protein [Spongiibacteraceae bacterium]